MIPFGKDLRVSILVNGVFVFMEGERSSNGALAKEATDTTDSGSSGWREGGVGGTRSSVVNFEGLVTDGPVQALVTARLMGRQSVLVDFSDGLVSWSGRYVIASLARNGVYNDAETLTVAFESAGPTSIVTTATGLQVSQTGAFIRVSQTGGIIEVTAA